MNNSQLHNNQGQQRRCRAFGGLSGQIMLMKLVGKEEWVKNNI